jgi:ethanolamine utilization cobalamin adenosyltransferase
VSIFKKAHIDLQKAGNKPDGRTKVRKFLQSIKAPELQTAVGVARSQDNYLTDFEETINYLRRFVMPTSTSRTVASMGAKETNLRNSHLV